MPLAIRSRAILTTRMAPRCSIILPPICPINPAAMAPGNKTRPIFKVDKPFSSRSMIGITKIRPKSADVPRKLVRTVIVYFVFFNITGSINGCVIVNVRHKNRMKKTIKITSKYHRNVVI